MYTKSTRHRKLTVTSRPCDELTATQR